MNSQSAGQVAGIDVGGTFTDLVLLDPATGAVRLAKVPATPENQAFGVRTALQAAGADLARLALIVHGTTTTTNAVLERKLARTGLITTQGFRDVLELGRRTRPQPCSTATATTRCATRSPSSAPAPPGRCAPLSPRYPKGCTGRSPMRTAMGWSTNRWKSA